MIRELICYLDLLIVMNYNLEILISDHAGRYVRLLMSKDELLNNREFSQYWCHCIVENAQ